jgi:hypothetical protein
MLESGLLMVWPAISSVRFFGAFTQHPLGFRASLNSAENRKSVLLFRYPAPILRWSSPCSSKYIDRAAPQFYADVVGLELGGGGGGILN